MPGAFEASQYTRASSPWAVSPRYTAAQASTVHATRLQSPVDNPTRWPHRAIPDARNDNLGVTFPS